MPKKAHRGEQIVAALQRVESGEKVGEVCRGLGISQGTFYVWKKHYAGCEAMKPVHIWWVALGFLVARWVFKRQSIPDPVTRLRSTGGL